MAHSEAHFFFDEAGFAELTVSPSGDVYRYMDRLGARIEQVAKRLAPTNTHLLQKSINHHVFVVGNQIAVEIGSPLERALFMHEGTHPHTIHPKRQQFLRFSQRGKVVFARSVAHPGTRPRPFLRLAMETEVRR